MDSAVLGPEGPEDFRTIGVVARLLGMKVETIRMWERRYQVVQPRRSAAGDRVYTDPMVRRLSLLKSLVNLGVAIGSVARLPDADLEARLASLDRAAPAARRIPAQPLSVIVVGEAAALRFSGPEVTGNLRVAAAFPSVAAVSAAPGELACDTLVVELPTLLPESLDLLEVLAGRVRAQGRVVLYRFGHRAARRALGLQGVVARQLPMAWPELRQACEEAAGRWSGPPLPAPRTARRRYSDAELAWIGAQASTVACECPQHLATLVSGLAAFETYSQQCGGADPADHALHHHLAQRAAEARHVLEEALTRLLEADGIVLPAA